MSQALRVFVVNNDSTAEVERLKQEIQELNDKISELRSLLNTCNLNKIESAQVDSDGVSIPFTSALSGFASGLLGIFGSLGIPGLPSAADSDDINVNLQNLTDQFEALNAVLVDENDNNLILNMHDKLVELTNLVSGLSSNITTIINKLNQLDIISLGIGQLVDVDFSTETTQLENKNILSKIDISILDLGEKSASIATKLDEIASTLIRSEYRLLTINNTINNGFKEIVKILKAK